MLLVVSAAGWWTFHRDLYVEEREVVEALKSSGQKVAFHHVDRRFFTMASEDEGTEIPWNAPLLEPIRMIYVDGAPSTEARDAALRLPQLTAYGQASLPGSTAKDNWRGIEALLRRPLPELPEHALDSARLELPLPEGSPLSESRAKQIAESIQAAWQNPDAVPPRRLVVRETSSEDSITTALPWRDLTVRVDVLEPGRGFSHSVYEGVAADETAALLLDDEVFWFRRSGANPWHRTSRRLHGGDLLETTLFRRSPDDEFPYVAADFSGDGIVGRWMADVAPRYEIQQVAKVDDVRYRVDFAPFDVPFDEVRDRGSLGKPRIEQWSLVLRSDLDWAPEESRMVQSKIVQDRPNALERSERRMAQRFVRVGDYVVLSERVASEERLGAPVLGPPDVTHSRYVTELDPEFDERVFDPLALDPEPWPERRELPWLRWYRVTFAIGCGLGLFLVGRKLSLRRNRATEPLQVESHGSDEANAEAVA